MSEITVAKGITRSALEASGLFYLSGIKSYVVVSDDTDENQPVLFLMDETGHVSRSTLIKGLLTIDDMEGITQDDGGRVYILASQSFNRNGKRAPERKLLARVHHTGVRFKLDGSVFLIDLLLEATLEKGSGEWGEFIKRSEREKSVDIEAVCCRGDTLLLGFKNPKINNCAVILAVSNPDEMFREKRLHPERISIWRKMTVFDSTTGTFCGISDLCFRGELLFGVSTTVRSSSGVDEDSGIMWVYCPKENSMRYLRSFSRLKPEGICFNHDLNEFRLVFDNGPKNPSQFMTVKVSP